MNRESLVEQEFKFLSSVRNGKIATIQARCRTAIAPANPSRQANNRRVAKLLVSQLLRLLRLVLFSALFSSRIRHSVALLSAGVAGLQPHSDRYVALPSLSACHALHWRSIAAVLAGDWRQALCESSLLPSRRSAAAAAASESDHGPLASSAALRSTA